MHSLINRKLKKRFKLYNAFSLICRHRLSLQGKTIRVHQPQLWRNDHCYKLLMTCIFVYIIYIHTRYNIDFYIVELCRIFTTFNLIIQKNKIFA